ncbi:MULTISPECIES: Tex family protein [unclassified Gemella]|uniref:Tex family protein n=1 Tax=unclassified Gemella TaxID=2624949 RepID=UPI0010749C5C|nr:MULTISPECIES: Tex family protein [unclassified Gemella]MBF0709661.1 RNA-binding transcriptional accessory protein [Gemella sp. GL1.1]MBF0746920.1 RNA-binding transcriptional accessory protein [Gemella sp. 19428wG2_WT2a]NYS27005.1 RNA-binding transcriptional accessory protein [Gemella sp. GL1]TFU59146.1 RNA-binding transcriptional accessory protein [Gemella sp. WT2a]
MYDKIKTSLAKKLKINEKYIENVLKMLEEGNTIAFIARYRKEMTNSLDEVAIKTIQDEYNYLKSLEKRKEEVIRIIEEKGLLTEELRKDILVQEKLQRVEDLYRPFKEKRKTKASISKEKGLEPLAKFISRIPKTKVELEKEAAKYINIEREVNSIDEAIAFSLDIIAENISDTAKYREYILENTKKFGSVESKLKRNGQEKDSNKIYLNYYEYSEKISRLASHRILALNRAEKEGIINISIVNDRDRLCNYILNNFMGNKTTELKDLFLSCIEDAYKRLIFPSIEREIRAELTKKAEEDSVAIFSVNLRQLLMQSPLKNKKVLGIDPAFRTGCKFAVVDEYGNFVTKGVMYPHKPATIEKQKEAAKILVDVIKENSINIIAIGNGTASRETESFVYNTLKDIDLNIKFCIVNEAGASIYSASEIAREEFPNFNVEERSAISIARRLQDPLSELVKIDPQSIGVGQYQHDISPKFLEKELAFVVETAVNSIGVDVNTASVSLMSYVSAINRTIAKNIENYRKDKGKITTIRELANVPRLGKKTFEQAVGFFRVVDGDNILDSTGIHPESYHIAEKLLEKLDIDKNEIGSDKILKKLEDVDLKILSNELKSGYETLLDIVMDLKQPMRDIRDDFEKPLLRSDILTIDDLQVGSKLNGTVRNITQFGAFIDIGLKQDAMVHISKISKKFIKNPLEVLSVGQIIETYVIEVDKERGRVSLSLFRD